MARGNCRSMKREIAGKMTSDVKGVVEVTAATAKELKATKTIILLSVAIRRPLKSKTYGVYRSTKTYLVTMKVIRG